MNPVRGKRNLIGGWVLFITLIIGAVMNNALALQIKFTTTVNPLPCSVEITGGDDNQGNLHFGDIVAGDLVSGQALSTSKVINLTLNNCSTDSTYKPSIEVGGTTVSNSDTQQNEFLFNSSNPTGSVTGMAKNIGFIMRFNDNSVVWSGAKGKNITSSSKCNVISQVANACGAKLPDGTGWYNTSIPVAVSISSGQNNDITSGSLTANVTFTFVYQ